MADSFTPTLNLTKPEINQSINTWGNKLNGDMDLIDQHAAETDAQLEDHGQRLDAQQAFLVPAGGIIMWSGAETAVPVGWALCNGANGTPNLRDKFVVCAGPTRAVGSTGGSNSQTVATSAAGAHAHGGTTSAVALTEAQMPSHQHGGGTDVQGAHAHVIRRNFEDAELRGVNIGSVSVGTDGSQVSTLGGGPIAVADTAGAHAHNIATDFRGGSQPHAHVIVGDGNHAHTVVVSTVPLYYALAFIMKLAAA